MQGLPVILKLHNLQSLDKALDLFIEFEFCESDFYFLDRSKKCIVATNNFGSVYTNFPILYHVCEYEYGRYSDCVSNIRGLFGRRTI